MEIKNDPKAKIRRLAIWYNQIVNVFWSVLSLAPIVYFCSTAMGIRCVIILGVLSLITGFLPRSFFNTIRLSGTTTVYHQIGIRTVRKYTQDGYFINQLLRRKSADYKLVNPTDSIKKHLEKADMNERFHFILFVFFLGATVHALLKGLIGWTLFFLISNLLYNVYPIFLQQYNRLRFQQLLKRSKSISSLP